MVNSWRSASALRIMLVAALATTAAVGGFNYVSAQSATSGPTGPSTNNSDNKTVSFTTADAGTCLTWQLSNKAISAFEQTDCAGPHRFEVSSRENLAVYHRQASQPNEAGTASRRAVQGTNHELPRWHF